MDFSPSFASSSLTGKGQATPSTGMDSSRSFASSSILTGMGQETPSTSFSRNEDEDIASDIAQLIAAICGLVMQTGGRVSLGTDLFYLNPLKTIGQGASFTVKAVDKELRYANRFHRESQANDYFNADTAFKRLRRFPPSSPEERARKLRMVRLEVAALSHPVLLPHENIIKIRGIGWEPCFYGTENPWPVLMVELAPHGTLADFQQTVTNLSSLHQVDLLMDIALGLEAVHKSGIIHGDVKSENVLVFDHPDRKYVAKLGDFAYSRYDAEDQGFIPCGTFPWQAPEVLERKTLTFNDWALSDIYSYGLLSARLLNGGASPFTRDVLGDMSDEDMKKQRILELKIREGVDGLLAVILKPLIPKVREEHVQALLEVLCQTIQAQPSRRSLPRAIDSLKPFASSRSSYRAPFVAHYPVHNPEDWNLLNHVVEQLEYSAQQALFKECLKLAESALPYDTIADRAAYERLKRQENNGTKQVYIGNCRQVFGFYASGLGTEKSHEEALKWLRKAARAGCLDSAASLLNLHDAFGIEFTMDDELQTVILGAALFGHPGAVRTAEAFDLFGQFDQGQLDQGSFKADVLLKKFPGTNSPIAMNDPTLFKRQVSSCLRKTSAQIGDIVFTANRDNLLHFCTIGRARHEILEHLLGQHKMDPNCTNSLGQTPLMLACRSGIASNVTMLLRHGATANTRDHVGCNPLHHFVSSQSLGSEFENVAADLVQHGADVNGLCTGATLSKGVPMMGSPMHIAVMSNNLVAVRALLQLGASPTLPTSDKIHLAFTPVELAASRALPDILKALLDAAPNYDYNKMRPDDGNTLLAMAIGADLTDQLKLHGSKFSESITRTVDILLPRTTAPLLNRWEQPLLPCAVMSGKAHLVRHLISSGIVGQDEINKEWRGDTPLNIAIQRRHREIFTLLLDHGADATAPKSLYWCARERGLNLSYAQRLLSQRNKSSPFIIYTAITHRNFALANLLLQENYSLNDRLSFGEVPCTVFSQILCDGPDLDILDYVLELEGDQKGDLGIHKAYRGCILHAMSESLVNSHDSLATRQIFHRVLKKHSDSSLVNFAGKGRKAHPMGVPLHCAVANANVEAVQELVLVGAKTGLHNPQGETPIELVEAMILSCTGSHTTPAHRAKRLKDIYFLLKQASQTEDPAKSIGQENPEPEDIPGEVENKYATLLRSGKTFEEVNSVFEQDIIKSKYCWEQVRKAQLMHVSASPRTQEDLFLCARFYEYLLSAVDEDLPALANGDPFPDREWKIIDDWFKAIGKPFSKEEVWILRQKTEDHPKIKEWLGKEFSWASELFMADQWAEKLCRYSPWRSETSAVSDRLAGLSV